VSIQRTATAILALSLALACSDDQSAPGVAGPSGQRPAGPIGEDSYAELLLAESGSSVSTQRLAELAGKAEESFEAKLDQLASRIRPNTDWRELFADLRQDRPSDREETIAAYHSEIERAAAFVARHQIVTLPPSLPEVAEARNRVTRENFPLALYMDGSLGITVSPGPELDFEYLANHCYVCIPPLAVHEGYPGHHVAFYHSSIAQAGLELGQEVRIRTRPARPFFHEGWGLYSELLMLNLGYYEGNPEGELGAWRLLLLRALRTRVDVSLHTGLLDEEGAKTLYQERLLMDVNAAGAEIRRHLANPTNKASYFVGLLQILELRRRVFEAEPGMTLEQFHDRLLRRPGPLPSVGREEFGLEPGSLAESGFAPVFSRP